MAQHGAAGHVLPNEPRSISVASEPTNLRDRLTSDPDRTEAIFALLEDRLVLPIGVQDRFALHPVLVPAEQALDAFRAATDLAAFIGRQLLDDFSVEDVVGEALNLTSSERYRFDPDLVMPAIYAVVNGIAPGAAPELPVADGACGVPIVGRSRLMTYAARRYSLTRPPRTGWR
jgi:hypothetical protein